MSKAKKLVAAVAITVMLVASNHVMAQNQPTPKARFQSTFAEMDTDNDGKVSYDEYITYHQKLAEERFKKMDADGDGFVTSEEHQEAIGQFMQKRRGRPKGPRGN